MIGDVSWDIHRETDGNDHSGHGNRVEIGPSPGEESQDTTTDGQDTESRNGNGEHVIQEDEADQTHTDKGTQD